MFPKNPVPRLSSAFVAGLLCAGLASHAGASVIFGDAADGIMNNSGTTGFEANDDDLRVGRLDSGSQKQRNAYVMFDLSSITMPVASASLDLFYVSLSDFDGNDPVIADLDVWAVGYGDSATDFPAGLVYVSSDTDATAGNVKIADDFIDNENLPADGSYVSTGSSTDLVDFINNRTGDFVFFRLNPDVTINSSNEFVYNISAADTLGTGQDPRLTLTAIPEPSSVALLAIGTTCLLTRR